MTPAASACSRDPETREILLRQVDAPLFQVGLDVANDVRGLQRQPEVEGVLARARIATAEHLDAHDADGGRDPPAIADELVEGLVTRAPQIHLDTVDEIVERLPRQPKRLDVRLEVLRLRRLGRVGTEEAADLLTPLHHLGRGRGRIRRLIHRIVDGAAEIPHHANGAALCRRQD